MNYIDGVLRLSGKKLTQVPISRIGTCQKADLSMNPIRDPEGLRQIVISLVELNITGCKITSIGQFDVSIASLQILRASGNRLDAAAISLIAQLPRLTHLDVSENELTKIPKFPASSSITDLNLSWNPFTNRTGFVELHLIRKLKTVSVNSCYINQIRPHPLLTKLSVWGNKLFDHAIWDICALAELLELDMGACELDAIPKFPLCAKLKILTLNQNEFSTPRGLKELLQIKSLIELDISQCSLDKISDQIDRDSSLLKLDISNNKLDAESVDEIFLMLNLRDLQMFECCLTSVPTVPVQSALERLELSGNHFKSSDGIELIMTLQNLNKLELYDCGITNIQQFDLNLCQLTELDLSHNKLDQETVQAVVNLPNLQIISLENCQLGAVPLINGESQLEDIDMSENPFKYAMLIGSVLQLKQLKKIKLVGCGMKDLNVKAKDGLEVILQ